MRKKTYSLFCGWPFPRHSRPSSHGQIWLMLNASPPSGTKQLSPSTNRRLHTLSPWWRAQHIEAPQSLSTLHRAPEMMMRITDSTIQTQMQTLNSYSSCSGILSCFEVINSIALTFLSFWNAPDASAEHAAESSHTLGISPAVFPFLS